MKHITFGHSDAPKELLECTWVPVPDEVRGLVTNYALAKILKIAFNTVWEQGLTFEEAYDELVVVGRRQTA